MTHDPNMSAALILLAGATHDVESLDKLIEQLVDLRVSRSRWRTQELEVALQDALSKAELEAQLGVRGTDDAPSAHHGPAHAPAPEPPPFDADDLASVDRTIAQMIAFRIEVAPWRREEVPKLLGAALAHAVGAEQVPDYGEMMTLEFVDKAVRELSPAARNAVLGRLDSLND